MQRWIKLFFAVFILINLSGFLTAHAEGVYKSIDANGNTIYSDQPSAGAQPVKLPPISIAPTPAINAAPTTVPAVNSAVVTPVLVYTQLDLISPLNDQTVWDNNGTVPVSVAVSPAVAASHTLQLILDGKLVAASSSDTAFTLNNLDRGTHVLQAQIIDSKKRVIKVSNVVTFYLHKTLAACNMPLKTCLNGNCQQELAYLGAHPACQNILVAQLTQIYQTYVSCQESFCPQLEKAKLQYELAQKKVDYQIKQAKIALQNTLDNCKKEKCQQLAVFQQQYQQAQTDTAIFNQKIAQMKTNAKASLNKP